MKKTISVILMLVILFLCSCGKSEKSVFIPQAALDADMEYVSEEFCFCARISCRSYSDIVITLTSPENLKGTVIKVSENGITAQVNGVQHTFEEKQFDGKRGLTFAVYALRRFLYTDCDYFETADGCCARASSVYGNLTAVCSAEGILKSVSAENIGIILT